MISFDTNILLYAFNQESKYNGVAQEALQQYADSDTVIISELVLVEFYLLLRNPAVLHKPLNAQDAVNICKCYRKHPYWALVETANIMDSVWEIASKNNFSRRKIIDVRLAKTLVYHDVKTFITANSKDFLNLGFESIINPCR